MSPALLGLLVFIDGTLCGFRVAAGRNPRLFLRAYYAQSMRRAALLALGVIALFSAVVWLNADAFEPLLRVADSMVQVYGVYATVVLVALGLYLVSHFDLGVLATVLVLGPFTLARPFVIALGAAITVWRVQHPVAIGFTIAAAATMLAFERLLELGRPPWR